MGSRTNTSPSSLPSRRHSCVLATKRTFRIIAHRTDATCSCGRRSRRHNVGVRNARTRNRHGNRRSERCDTKRQVQRVPSTCIFLQRHDAHAGVDAMGKRALDAMPQKVVDQTIGRELQASVRNSQPFVDMNGTRCYEYGNDPHVCSSRLESSLSTRNFGTIRGIHASASATVRFLPTRH